MVVTTIFPVYDASTENQLNIDVSEEILQNFSQRGV